MTEPEKKRTLKERLQDAIDERKRLREEKREEAGPEEGPSEAVRPEARVRRPPPVRKASDEPKEPEGAQEAAEPERLLKEAETLFIDGDVERAAELFARIVKEYADSPPAHSTVAKAREYLELLE